MDHASDEAERARAAVAVACLRWLRCTGPGPLAIDPPHRESRDVRALDQGPPPGTSPAHPLWDRWLDG